MYSCPSLVPLFEKPRRDRILPLCRAGYRRLCVYGAKLQYFPALTFMRKVWKIFKFCTENGLLAGWRKSFLTFLRLLIWDEMCFIKHTSCMWSKVNGLRKTTFVSQDLRYKTKLLCEINWKFLWLIQSQIYARILVHRMKLLFNKEIQAPYLFCPNEFKRFT